MHVGIDLGTTNSVLALFDGDAVSVVPSDQGENLTPSVVRIDARGTVTVGRRAFRFLESDPANTRGEFKRLMGTAEPIRFEAAKKALLPEELSAEVLRSLLADAQRVLGFLPRRAVISTPALFELPQNHATVAAGKRAGLEEVVLIQEPIASAIAAGWRAEAGGMWLVFDLGGGTLDVSLLETREGFLRVVDHGGDNFLGGKDFDNVLVDWAVSRLKESYDLPDLDRANPASRRRLAQLKAACEQAKIDLSRVEHSAVSFPELGEDARGRPVEVDLPVTRVEFEALVAPHLERCLSLVRSVIEHNGVAPEAIVRVVFVGGPTLMPALRRKVGELFGGRVAEGLDPMTLVARGASLFAATAGLEAGGAPVDRPAVVSGLALRIEHPPVTADTRPYVVGRFLLGEGQVTPRSVRALREDGASQMADAEVTPEGSFVLQVELAPQRRNRFRLVARDAAGREVALRSPEFAIVHGISIADPPLSRTVGVALANDTVHVYFPKGTPLPARRSYVHQTITPLRRGDETEVLRIPVVQGEFFRAHRNRLIGTLRVRGLEADLPAGSRIEVLLQLDRSGQLQARAEVPALGQTFEDVVHVLVPSPSFETLEKEAAAAEQRLADAQRSGFKAGHPETLRRLSGAVGLMAEVRAGLSAARGGDADAAQRVTRLLLELGAEIDAAEGELEWPELEAEADDVIQTYGYWVAQRGTASEQQLFEESLAAALAARKARAGPELDRQVKVMRKLGTTAYARDPLAVREDFEWLAANVAEATDVRKASELVTRGRAALEKDDLQALRTINQQLWALHPGTPEERRRSFGSGIVS